MMTIDEVRQAIEAAKLKRDFMHELTPANQMLLSRRNGTFEAVLTGKGDEKCLIPEVGVLHYLYRGQNTEYESCIPTIYRGDPSDAQIFLQRMRLVQFERLLKSHPVVTGFFEKHHFLVDVEGLAQHYGLNTEVLDLTSSLDVALFFATCKYDKTTDSYDYYHEKGPHEGVLYVFDPILDNEPTPSLHFENYLNGNITPIGLQAFPRPGAQFGYALHIKKGGSTKSWMYKFSFTSDESKHYYDKFQKGESLWIKDKLISKTQQITKQTTFSFSVFNEACERFRPKGLSKTKLKAALQKENVVLLSKKADLVFDEGEKKEIVDEWNNSLGRAVSEKIVRKCWFEHEGEEKSDGDKWDQVVGIKNRSEFNTLQHISEYMTLLMISDPKGPEGAEWKNYTNTPRPKEKSSPNDGHWKKIPATMISVFGKPYLSEEDWRISNGKTK